jgi:DNA-binding GntR family transcriptional regulator
VSGRLARPGPERGGGCGIAPSKQELVYSALRARILNGTYGPGYRLVIGALAREFATSPIPIREAVRRLEAEGLVQYEQNKGARVAPVDERRYADAFYVLAILEGAVTALAAPRVSAKVVRQLRQLNREMVAMLETFDVLSYAQLNRAFHAVIYDLCPNAYLRETIRTVVRQLDAMRRTVFTVVPGRSKESVAEHEQLIRLFETGAPEAEIEAFARQHKLKTLAAFQAWERTRHPN